MQIRRSELDARPASMARWRMASTYLRGAFRGPLAFIVRRTVTAFTVLFLWLCCVVGTTVNLVGRSSELPALSAARSGSDILFRWPATATNFFLEQTDSVSGLWTTAPGTPQRDDEFFVLHVPPQGSHRFFRLRSDSVQTTNWMGIVLSFSGQPLANVNIGPRVTDQNGIFTGTFNSSNAWIQIEALGHAHGYAKSGATLPGKNISETWLTPFHMAERLTNRNSTTRLFVGAPDAPALETWINAQDLAGLLVTVSITELHPLDVGPAFAPLAPDTNRYLARAFFIGATDNARAPIALLPGRSINLVAAENAAAPTPWLCRFDPQSGTWIVLEGACQRTDQTNLTCTIDRLNTVYGLFAEGQPPYLAPSPASRSAPTAPLSLQGLDDSDADYKLARGRLGARLREIELLNLSGGQIDPAEDLEVRRLLEELKNLAQQFSASHRDESGKLRMLLAAVDAQFLGQDDLSDELWSDAVQISNELALRLVESNPDCERLPEALNTLAQMQLMGGNESIAKQLEVKISNLLSNCDVWVGTIRYDFTLGLSISRFSTIEVDPHNWTRESNSSSWTEQHDLRFVTDSTLHLTVTDRVQLSFPPVKFRNQNECGLVTIEYNPEPSEQTNELHFSGFYDGLVGVIHDGEPAPGAQPVYAQGHATGRTKNNQGVCVVPPSFPPDWTFPPYFSLLIHGFAGFEEAPPPFSLQDLFDIGTHTGAGAGETVQGSETIQYLWDYPFSHGRVDWSFTRVNALLTGE